MRAFIIFSFCVTLFTSLSAESVSIYGDCAAEIESDCKSVKKTRARIMQCLLEKGKNISAKCQTSMDKLAESFREKSSQVCKVDVQEHCTWIVPGGGRIIRCLLKNESKLSEKCAEAMNEI